MAIILSSTLYGQEMLFGSNQWRDCNEPSLCCREKRLNKISVEIQSADFFPLDAKVQHIYSSVFLAFTLEGNWQSQCWGMWLNCSYIFGNGHSISFDSHKTHLSLVPITLGIKYIHPLCDSTDFYIGLGACYSFLNTKDQGEFIHKRVSSNAFGAIVKTGITYNFCENLYIDGFLNYTYQRFTFSKTRSDPLVYRHTAKLDSLQVSLGLGIKF